MINYLFALCLFLFGLPGLPLWLLTAPYLMFAREGVRSPDLDVDHRSYKFHGGSSGQLGMGFICWIVCGGIGWITLVTLAISGVLL